LFVGVERNRREARSRSGGRRNRTFRFAIYDERIGNEVSNPAEVARHEQGHESNEIKQRQDVDDEQHVAHERRAELNRRPVGIDDGDVLHPFARRLPTRKHLERNAVHQYTKTPSTKICRDQAPQKPRTTAAAISTLQRMNSSISSEPARSDPRAATRFRLLRGFQCKPCVEGQRPAGCMPKRFR
jgi:hypothetical protein